MLWLITFLVCAVVSNSQITGDGTCVINVVIVFVLPVWVSTVVLIVMAASFWSHETKELDKNPTLPIARRKVDIKNGKSANEEVT